MDIVDILIEDTAKIMNLDTADSQLKRLLPDGCG